MDSFFAFPNNGKHEIKLVEGDQLENNVRLFSCTSMVVSGESKLIFLYILTQVQENDVVSDIKR